ncbi:MAG TPA: chloride channel protein [Gammaproteobacteria bacterium]|nr:chloride channel protein [Gammaproteobacteria bacterium]
MTLTKSYLSNIFLDFAHSLKLRLEKNTYKISVTDQTTKLEKLIELIPSLGLIRDAYHRFHEQQQLKLSKQYDGLPLLAFLGVLTGLAAGAIIIAFRYALELGTAVLPMGGDPESFESLNALMRFALCVGGAVLLGLILTLVKKKDRDVGVGHVLTRLEYHQGHLPFKRATLQFLTATIALISGQSMGKEGPSIHLGASGGSLLGRVLKIPNNGVRILVGAGVAAAIAAAFDTPLAGVIFAMEVVVMEYTVFGFTPIILAAVSATTITRLTLGSATAIAVPVMPVNTVLELPLVAIMGLLIGALAALFIKLSSGIAIVSKDQPVFQRMLIAGVFTGLCAVLVPQIMGIGYDTVDALLLSQLSLGFVIGLLVMKLLATSVSIGLGMPAGLIGPTLFIGASAGGLIGLGAQSFSPNFAEPGWYAVLGMAAMMAATLQAPLAALIYLLELTASPSIVLPGMLAVISATLMAQGGFGQRSIYRHLLQAHGNDYRNSSLSIALRKIGVASVMDRNFLQQHRRLTLGSCKQLLKDEPSWLLVVDQDDTHNTSVLPATDIARHLNELDSQTDVETEIDLLKIPAKRLDTRSIPIIATLQEAHEKMQNEDIEVLYIVGAHGKSKSRIYGVLTREHIEKSYQV